MFLSAVRPFIREKCEIQLRVKREGAALSLVIIPKIEGIDPDTDDAALAALQAALTKPFHLHVADAEDPDQALANALTSIGQAQAGVHDDLEKYKAGIEADRVAAKEAAEKKKTDDKAKADALKAKKVPPAKPLKAPVTKSAPEADTIATPPEPVVAIDLFAASHAVPEYVAAPPASEPVNAAPAAVVHDEVGAPQPAPSEGAGHE